MKKILATIALTLALTSCATFGQKEEPPMPDCRISCIYSWMDCVDAGGTKDVCAVLQIKCMDRCD